MTFIIFVEIKSCWELYKMLHAFLRVTGSIFTVNQRAISFSYLKELANAE